LVKTTNKEEEVLLTRTPSIPELTGNSLFPGISYVTRDKRWGCKRWLGKKLYASFLNTLCNLASRTNAKRVIDVGCGDAVPLIHLWLGLQLEEAVGIDTDPQVLRVAERNLPEAHFVVGSIYDIPTHGRNFDLVVCSEVLEHLEAPQRALAALASLKSSFFLISCPNEPLYRLSLLLRGKYVGRWGSSPGHVNHWSPGALVKLASEHLQIVEARLAGLSTVLLATPKG